MRSSRKYHVAWPGDEIFETAHRSSQEQAKHAEASRPPAFILSTKPVDPNHKSDIRYFEYPSKKSYAQSSRADDKRPNSMKNRYFSNDNAIEAEGEEEQIEHFSLKAGQILEDDLIVLSKGEANPKLQEQKQDTVVNETPAFVKRRDYLLTKLMKAHTLPGLDEALSK